MKVYTIIACLLGLVAKSSGQNINLHLSDPADWDSYTLAGTGFTTVVASVDDQSIAVGDCVNLLMEFTVNLTATTNTLGRFSLIDGDTPESDVSSWLEVGDGTNPILPRLHIGSTNDGVFQGGSVSAGLGVLVDGADYKFHWGICYIGGNNFIHSIELVDKATGDILLDRTTSKFTEHVPGFDETNFTAQFGSMGGTEIAFTPEPSSAFLLLLAGLGFGSRRRR